MKKFAHALAITMILTGAVSSLNTAKAVTTAANVTIQKPSPKPTDFPLPVCPPDDPNHCGMGQEN